MPSIISATTTNGLSTSADNSGSLQLATNNGTTAVTIDTSQNVGIGTSSPKVFLSLGGGAATGQVNSLRLYDDGAAQTSTTSNSYGFGFLNAVGGFTYSAGTGGYHGFFTANTERMRITSGGDVFVGNTTGNFSTVNGALIGATGRFLGTCTSDATFAGSRLGSDGNVAAWYRNTALVGSISVTASSTAYNTSSDYRLKEDIAPMTGALATVAQLKPVTYKWKANGSDGQGFIAHELQAVVPDCVSGEKDAVDEEGKPVYQGVDTSFLVATLTAAIQEQQAQIEELKAEVQALKGVA